MKYRLLLAVSIAACIGVALRVSFSTLTLPDILADLTTFTFGILYEALPFVVMGTIFSVLIQSFFSQKTLLRILPSKPALQRAALSMSGSIMPVCECGNVPTARSLLARGVAPASVITFLLAAPIINPITIATTSQAFSSDSQVLVLRIAGALLIANATGWVFRKAKRKDITTNAFQAYCAAPEHQTLKHQSPRQAGKKLIQRFQDELVQLLPSLVTGSLIAGLVQTLIPRSWLLTLSSEPIIAITALVALAFIVSICANVDAFFALSLAGIFPTSAIVAFLVFGPMIDIKMLSLLQTTFKKPFLAQLSIMVFLASIVFGLVVHYVA